MFRSLLGGFPIGGHGLSEGERLAAVDPWYLSARGRPARATVHAALDPVVDEARERLGAEDIDEPTADEPSRPAGKASEQAQEQARPAQRKQREFSAGVWNAEF